jgi:hypothetical protein
VCVFSKVASRMNMKIMDVERLHEEAGMERRTSSSRHVMRKSEKWIPGKETILSNLFSTTSTSTKVECQHRRS